MLGEDHPDRRMAERMEEDADDRGAALDVSE